MKIRLYIASGLILIFAICFLSGTARPTEQSTPSESLDTTAPVKVAEIEAQRFAKAVMFEPAQITPEPSESPLPITTADWYGVPENELDPRLQGMYIPTVEDVMITAKMTHGESRGIESITEQASDIWCALNRVGSTGYAMGHSLTYVVTFEDQFHGYSPRHPTTDDFGRDLIELTKDVITRWLNEKLGFENVGRVLPADYMWFESDGHGHNVFRNAYHSKGADIWRWTLPSPYEN